MPRKSEKSADRIAEAQQHNVPVKAVAFLEATLWLAHNQLRNLSFHEDEDVDQECRNQANEGQPLLNWTERNYPPSVLGIARRNSVGNLRIIFNIF